MLHPWFRLFAPVSCGGLGGGFIQDPALFDAWKGAAGTPRRLRTVEAALAGYSWSSNTPPDVDGVGAGVLNAPWFPANTATLTAGGAVGAGFPSFNGWRSVPFESGDPDYPDPGFDPRAVIGLTMTGVDEQGGDRPWAAIDFAEPMSAVWVELDNAPRPLVTLNSVCGVRFQHRVALPGGGHAWVTLASLKSNARCGGIALDLANIALQASGSTNPADYGIDRVVFDPPEESGEPVRLTRLANVAWRTLASAQTDFGKPYRLVVVGSVAPGFDPAVFGSNFGSTALRAMWPFTPYRFRMNSQRVIAGTYYRAAVNGLGGGTRAAIWRWSDTSAGWVRTELEEAATEPRVDTIACSITDPYVVERGDWVMMVGGARTVRCTGTALDDITCGKPHAAAWCVRLGAYGGSGPVAPVAVVPVAVTGDCDGTVVDESVIRDLVVVANDAGPGSIALGCGAIGMWCGQTGSPTAHSARTHAAALPLRTSGATGYAGAWKVIHHGRPLACSGAVGAGPAPLEAWSSSAANGWVRGAPGQWAHSVIGEWEGDLRCDIQVAGACDRYSSAMQWDWTSWAWESGVPHDPDENAYPWLRAAPAGSRRPFAESGLLGDDDGGKDPDPPFEEPIPQQVFAAHAAVRTPLALGGAPQTPVVTSVGWLVDGCFNLTLCGCDSKAAVFEYPDAVGTGFWEIVPDNPRPWISAVAATNGGMRALSLHDVGWTGGGLADSPNLRPFSKASAVVAVAGGEAENRRMVLGAGFDAYGGAIDLDTLRGVIWRGSSASLEPTPHVPDSQWCGTRLQDLVHTVQFPDGQVETWEALSQTEYIEYPLFRPNVSTGQDIGASARVVAIGRLRPTDAFQVCLLVPRADITGDGLVNGADLGMLMAAWGGAHLVRDLDVNGVVSGADLGMLLSQWGGASVDFSCGAHVLSSRDIEVVLIAAQAVGFEDFDDLQFGMSLMSPPQAEYLAEFISLTAEAIREGGES